MTSVLDRPRPGPSARPRPAPGPGGVRADVRADVRAGVAGDVLDRPKRGWPKLDQLTVADHLPGWLIAEQLARIPAPLRRVLPDRDRFWTPRRWRLFVVSATVLAFVLRAWRNPRSVDLFIDEPFYAQVGQSISHGRMPFATGSPFFLHPPGFFVVEAGWIRLFGLHDGVFAQVYSLRKLVAVIAALTALLLAVLVRKAVGQTVAAIVVIVYLVNAYATNQSSIVILEPITLMWTLAGFAVFAYLAPSGKRRHRQLLLAGLLFGVANLSKEFAVFVTVVPLLIALVLRCWLTRREAMQAIAMACVPWVGWLILIASTGYTGDFISQVTAGFHRTTGKSQISGFNSKNAPSFLDTVIANLGELWTTYAILGLGSLAIVYVAWKYTTDPRLRFLSLFGVGAIPLLAYCVLLGTNEEQFFNFLFFPALICLVAVVWTQWRRIARPLKWALLALLAAGLISDSVEYVATHVGSDNGTYQIDTWMAEHVAPGTVIGTTNPVQRQVFLRYTMMDDAPNTRLDPRVKYLVVFYRQVDQGYAFVDRATIDRQVHGQRAVYSTTHKSNGRMVIYAIG